MKKILTLLLLSNSFFALAQQEIRKTEQMHPIAAPAIKCGGSANMISLSPIIEDQQQNTHFGPRVPAAGQHIIDSIKASRIAAAYRQGELSRSAAKTTSVSPVLGRNFAGTVLTGMSPLDNTIAVSNSGYIVTACNSKIAFFTLSGTQLYNNTFAAFLPFTIAGAATNPVVLYDDRADRFILVAQETMSATSRAFICFSKTNNPTGGWWCYSVPGDPTATGLGFDFPRIAVNDSELFITSNLYNSPGTASVYFDRAMIFQMDKLAGYSGTSLSYVYYNYIAGSPFSLLPLSNGQAGGITTGMHLVSTVNTGANFVNYYHITGSFSGTPTMSYSVVSTPTYSLPVDAPQAGTSTLLEAGDCRVLSGFYLNGYAHYAFNCEASSGYTGISYHRLNTTTSTDSSSLLGVSGNHYAYPAIASYATSPTDASVMIGFQKTGASMLPEIDVVNCDSAWGWSGTTVVKASQAYVTGATGTVGWGDYMGMARNHTSAAPSVWMAGMFGNTSHNWDGWVAEIHDAITTPCIAADSLWTNLITTTGATLHWKGFTGAGKYNIKYKPSASSTWLTTTATTNSKALTGLTPATHYDYMVQTVCFGDSASFGLTDTFTTKSMSGLEELNAVQAFSFSPNPVTGTLTVMLNNPAASPLNIQVIDMNGRVIRQLYNGLPANGTTELRFDTKGLSNGIYLLELRQDNAPVSRSRMVINHQE
jgi:hypothetical protein